MGFASRRAVVFSVGLIAIVSTAIETARAAPRMYTGSVELRMSFSGSSTYSFPLGSAISYPNLNNLPTGDLANVSGSGPASITFGADQLMLGTSLWTPSPPSSWPGSYAFTQFVGANGAATFQPGGAPGSTSFAPVPTIPGSRLGVSFSGSPVAFGGTMRLLGSFTADYAAGARYTFPIDAVGGAFGGTATATDYRYGTFASPLLFTATVWGFPWTVGTVSARAPGGSAAATTSTLTAMGTDQRTLLGAGHVRLVSPFVVRAVELDTGDSLYYRAGVAVASLHFVPEPVGLVQLAVGMAGLLALYRFSHRKR